MAKQISIYHCVQCAWANIVKTLKQYLRYIEGTRNKIKIKESTTFCCCSYWFHPTLTSCPSANNSDVGLLTYSFLVFFSLCACIIKASSNDREARSSLLLIVVPWQNLVNDGPASLVFQESSQQRSVLYSVH
jgi:hypothetical protein